MSTLAGSDGSFVFCPIPAGTYDIVVVGQESNDGPAYQPSIVTGIANGQTTGTIGLYLPPGVSPGSSLGSVVTLSGLVTSQVLVDIQLSALETPSAGGTSFTIPLLPNSTQSAAMLSLETAASSTCASGTDCAGYAMMLPSGGPFLGTYSAAGVTLSQTSPLANYVVDGLAFAPSSGGTADCTPSELKTQPYVLTPGGSLSLATETLAFTQCQ
jgi:hypothetical protein